MQALKFTTICNRCDEGVYDAATGIVEAINNSLNSYDYHNPNYLYVNGVKTNRFVEQKVTGASAETLVAVSNVFQAGGYYVMVNDAGDAGATIIVVFDTDIAPGPVDDGDEGDFDAGDGAVAEGTGQGDVSGVAQDGDGEDDDPEGAGAADSGDGVAAEAGEGDEPSDGDDAAGQASGSGNGPFMYG